MNSDTPATVSINSTSANRATVPTSAVTEQAVVPALVDYTIVAINDLGMHCGDLDTRISSILPPFNVLHSQVIQRGNGGLPQMLGEGQVNILGLSEFPNDESHNLYNVLPRRRPVWMTRLDENMPCIAHRRQGVVSDQAKLQAGHTCG